MSTTPYSTSDKASVTAASGATVGVPYKAGLLFGSPASGADAGEPVSLDVEALVAADKQPGLAMSQGDAAYWNVAGYVDDDSTNDLIGVVLEDAGASAARVNIRYLGQAMNPAALGAGSEAAVALNTSHRTSDGKDHSDVGLANTHRGQTDNPHAVTYTQAGAAPTVHTHAHEDTTGKQGGTAGEYYHLTSAQHAALTLYGSQVKRTPTAVSYLATSSDVLIGVTNTAATRTITLPTSEVSIAGRIFTVADESGNADTFPIQVVGEGGELIDGEATQELYGHDSMTVYATGTAWKVM